VSVTYLYIYRNDGLRLVYVGIGENLSRIWESHNAHAEALLAAPGTHVFVTEEPFPTREAAETAESAAICAAAAAGVDVLSSRDDAPALTNIAKVAESKYLARAVHKTDGVVDFTSFTKTAFVVVSVDQLPGDPRPTLHGGRSVDVFAERARKYWPLGAAEARRRAAQLSADGQASPTLVRTVEQLVMVQKSTGTILGAWALAPEQWRRCGSENEWEFLLDAPIAAMRGKRLNWNGYGVGTLITWSVDLKAA
jgi:hypothetical protein